MHEKYSAQSPVQWAFVCILEYLGSFERLRLHFTSRDCDLIGLGEAWGFQGL